MYYPSYINNLNALQKLSLRGNNIPAKDTVKNIKCENVIDLDTFFTRRQNNDYSLANQLLLKKVLVNLANNQVYIERKINEIIDYLFSLQAAGNIYTYYKLITESTNITHTPDCNGIIHINSDENLVNLYISSASEAKIGDSMFFIMSSVAESYCKIYLNNNEEFLLRDGISTQNLTISTGTTLKLICTQITQNINQNVEPSNNDGELLPNNPPSYKWLAMLETSLKV